MSDCTDCPDDPADRYVGDLVRPGCGIVLQNLSLLRLRHDLARYADGFDWGNGLTPGALQLAVALLADATGDDQEALRNHEYFAEMVLADLPTTKWAFQRNEVLAALPGLPLTRRRHHAAASEEDACP